MRNQKFIKVGTQGGATFAQLTEEFLISQGYGESINRGGLTLTEKEFRDLMRNYYAERTIKTHGKGAKYVTQ